MKKKMETSGITRGDEFKLGEGPLLGECPQNGTGCPSDASEPEGLSEYYEADRLTVHLVLARKKGTRKVGELGFVDREQRPFVLFADPEDALRPWGTAVEKFIAAAIEQAEKAGSDTG